MGNNDSKEQQQSTSAEPETVPPQPTTGISAAEMESTNQRIINQQKPHTKENKIQVEINDANTESSYVTKNEDRGAWKKSLKKGEIPEPVPQKTRKDNFLGGVDFDIVDQHALKAPKTLLEGTFWDLIQYLTDDDLFDDLVRVRSIYRWITSYDIPNMDISVTPQPDSPLEYFSKIQCDMGNLANLFYILCTMAEVPCKVIDGITKNEDYVLGEPETTEMKAQWNAVFVQNEWRLVDVFWAKWCVKVNSGDDDDQSLRTKSVQGSVRNHDDEADDEYFFADAHQMIWTHFPEEDKWQLLTVTISKSEFLNRLYVRERSRELGISYPYDQLILKVDEGQAKFSLDFPSERGINYHFKHNFIRMRTENDELKRLDKILHHFILFERHDDNIYFMFNIPVLGKFRVNIFASDPYTEGLERFDLICSFLVISDILSKECLPMPDYPKIGWGPNKTSRQFGITPVTHEESSIYTTTGEVELKFKGKQELKLEMKLLNPFIDSANMSKYAMIYWKEGQYIVRTRLPRHGIYGLKFFTREEDTMEQINVLNYLIHCSMKEGKVKCLPHIAQDNLGPYTGLDRLGIKATAHENGYIVAKDGHANVEFMTKADVNLVGELHCNDTEAVPRMRVQQYNKNNKQAFAIDVPVKGEYGFNVYAIQKDEPQKLNNAYSFLINSHGRHIDVGTLNNKTLENSRNFWKNTKEVIAESIITTDTEVFIPVPMGLNSLVAFLQKADRSEPQNSESIQLINEKGIDIYKVTLDDLGDYTFNVFQQDNKFLRLVSRFNLTRNDHKDEMEEDAKEVLEIIKEERESAGTDVTDLERHINASHIKEFVDVDKRIQAAQQLAEALRSNDPQQIRKALSEYQYNKAEGDDNLLKEGRKKLRQLEAKYDLLRAYKARELTNLDRAIAVATAVNEDKSFNAQLVHAKRLRDRLAAVRTMQDIVRNTDNRVVGEIRQYNTPPVGVHQTVMAALMLMGYDTTDVKTWKQCQKILGQHGDKSFLSQMSRFDPKDVNLGLALEAKKSVEPYTAEQIHTESSGAASIFIWVESMIKEIESNAGTLGIITMVPERTRAKTEIEKPVKVIPPTESPNGVKRKGGKPTLVTLESLLIESPIPPPSPIKSKSLKPQVPLTKKTDPATKSQLQNQTQTKGVGNKTKKDEDKIDKSKERAANSDTKQLSKNDKNNKNSKTVPTKENSNNTKIIQVTPRDKEAHGKPLEKDLNKPKTDFIAKNVKSVKPKGEDKEDDEDNISSYLTNYRKKREDNEDENIESNSVDGHLSIGSNEGKPHKLSGSYHGPPPLVNDTYQSKYVYDFDILGGLGNDETIEPEPDVTNKKSYKAIFNRRKEDKEVIQRMWASRVKAK